MTAPFTPADARRDASDIAAERCDDAVSELYAGRDEWVDDERPTRAEIERDEFADWSWWREQGGQR